MKIFCKEILNKYEIGHIIIKEKQQLLNIFKNHNDWEIKRGVGGKAIFIGKDAYNHRCFFIKRIDDTITDISYLKSINGKKETDLNKIKKACRSSVFPIIKDFRNNNVIFGKTKCIISGEVLTKENTNIDHYDLTFIEMFDLWIKKQNIEQLSKKINNGGDLEQSYFFTDKIIEENFVNFHNENCKLRAVTKYVNQVLLRKK